MANTAFKRIVKVLLESPGLTRSQIAERAFVGKTTLSGGGYLKTMKESGLIHISGWLRNPSGRFSTPLTAPVAAKIACAPRPRYRIVRRREWCACWMQSGITARSITGRPQ